MDSTKIPVTLDFFKKYTYHEEWVDVMFKTKAKGNQQIYDALCNSPESKERALKLYYEAFYLKPEIRKKYHIRLKPAPKKIKDKLLVIPVQDDTGQANENDNKIQQDSPMQELLIGELKKAAKSNTDGNANLKGIQRKRLMIQAEDSAEQEVEDDSQPISSSEKTDSTTELNENIIIVETIQDNNITPVEIRIHETIEKAESEKSAIKKSPIVKQKPKEIPAIGSSQSEEHNLNNLAEQQTNNKVTSTPSPKKSPITNGKTKAIMSAESNNNLQQNSKESIDYNSNLELQMHTSAANQKPFDYKSLVPYLHCCPVTYKEFRKYSNINELVKELCKKKHLNTHEERLILNRSYILFYLAPEHRNISPINKIQLAENCPKHISDKFFNIPTKLYLKERSNEVEKEPASTATKDQNNSNKNVAVTTTEQNIGQNTSNCETKARTQTQNTSCNDQIICQDTNNTEAIPVNQTQNMPITVVNQKSCTNNNTDVLRFAQETQNTGSNDQSKSQHMTNNEEICLVQPQITACSTKNDSIFPVTFEEFKQNTFYEHVIDNLFKSVASGEENIYLKYKNSQEAFNATLMNYYRAFYLIPVVRDKFPIQLKYTTTHLINRVLQIPQGIDVNAFANIGAKQLVFPEFKDFVEIKEELNDVDVVPTEEEGQETVKIAANCPAVNNQLAVDENAMECVHSVSETMVTLRTCTVAEVSTLDNPGSCPSAMPSENSEQCLDPPLQSKNKTTSCLTGVKRSPITDIKEPSPKRSKIEQTQNVPENTTKPKKNYKELLRYAHCCPVTFSQFKKYTNISELFTAYCLNRYKDLKKLPFILHRAYILHYLAPENRKLKPFNKLKLTDDCPHYLKEKIFEIPDKLYVQAQKNVNPLLVLKQEINKEQSQPKTLIEILENRLLPPATLNLANPSGNTESLTPLKCSNTNCVFHYISHHDFMQQTNILQFLPLPHDMNVVKNMFKIFIHKIIKESYCDDLYIHAALVSKILKHQHICENCEHGIAEVLNMNTANACVVSQQERASRNENVIERNSNISERNQPMEINTVLDKVRPEEEINKSSAINEKENVTTNSQVQVTTDETSTKTLSHDIIRYLQQEKTFQKFRQKLLTKLNQNLDSGMDFTSDTYKIFLQCNEIPLRQILNDFCAKKDVIVERILKDKELCDALGYYYYWKYVTNSNFASKYPVKIRNSEEHYNLTKENNTDVEEHSKETNVSRHTNAIKESQIEDGKTKAPEDGKELQKNINTSTVAKCQDASEKQTENTNQNNKALEKAKRIFFRNVERMNTLSYVVRTSFGLKQLILRSILTMSYEEFLQLTSIYEGQSLYKDSHIAECMYRYVFRAPNVWPTNLFITLQNLCDFLHKKNIHFNKHSNMLADVSPKLLHWSDLRTCTNIENSVSIDYEKRIGKKLNFNDAIVVNNELNEYYNRCWKQEKWLGQLPLVYIDYYTNYPSNSGSADVTMFDECALQETTEEPVKATTNACATQECLLQEIAEETVQSITNLCPSQELTLQETTEGPVQSTTNVCPSQECASQEIPTLHQEHIEQSEDATQNVNSPEEIVPDFVAEVDIGTDNAVNISSNANQSIKEFNCVLLPNTQQQINMLPSEVGVTNDPLGNCSMNINSLNESAPSSGNCEVITLDEQSSCIKTEPIDKNLLNNLLFYEDDDSNIQCVACEEEIVNLDDTISPICCDLIPSQLEFDDVVPQQLLSDNLVLSDSSNSDINLAQRLPSSIESNSTLCSQQFMNLPAMTSTQMIQLPDVSLGSSGENTSQQQQNQKQNTENGNGNKVEEYLQEVVKENEGKIEQLANILQQLENTTGLETATTQKEAQSLPISLETKSDSLEMEQQQQDTMTKNNVPSDEVKGNVNVIGNPRAVSLLRQSTMTIAISKKNVAKVRPLKNSTLVPQIEHTTRPLVTIPVYPLGGAKTVNDLNQQKHDLIAANCSITIPTTVSTTQSSIVLRISQELNTNCSVFDNSSLLRLVDHNYHHSLNTLPQSPSTSAQAKALLPSITLSAGNQQSFSCLESNSQSSNIKSARKLSIAAETDIAASSSHITSSTSIGLNHNDKVNNDASIRTYKNLVATVSPLRHHPYNRFARKESLFRRLLKFHYFKELSHSNIKDYLLPSLEIGKSYTEATVVSEDFRTRLTNKSIAAIFPFWPKTLQRDFLLVLNDLKEFHYASFERNILKNHEDLRARILFWLLHTAPSFALCQFSFEGNSTEFAHCERVHNGNNNSYYRKPFNSLTKAIDGRILERIKAKKKGNGHDEDNDVS